MADQGSRCQVCTGCGRCGLGDRLAREMKVVTASFCMPEDSGSDMLAEFMRGRTAGPQREAWVEHGTESLWEARGGADMKGPWEVQVEADMNLSGETQVEGCGEGLRESRVKDGAEGPREAGGEVCAGGPGEVRIDAGDRRRRESRAEESTILQREELVTADLGTTTIAMEWYDSQGQKSGEYVCANPQRIFGTDVISRIQAAENPMLRRQMQQAVKRVLAEGIADFRGQGGNPEKLIIAGNTTMLYLLTGHDPASLGTAPFRADYLASERLTVEGVKAETLPGLSAFVGGDITAGILACGMDQRKEVTLLADLGTNGELVLGNRERLVCCGTAAGPAFEGGGEIWGADMIALTARLLELGLADETGLLKEPYFENGILIGDTRITQERIRSLQTAKAAVCAGIKALAAAYGLDGPGQICRVWLAGGFGYFLDAGAAIELGLLPRELDGRVTAVGNSALAGAWLYGSRPDMAERAERLRQGVQVLNLACQKEFESDFVEAMYLRRT